jgi:FkbM family methyltransferase
MVGLDLVRKPVGEATVGTNLVNDVKQLFSARPPIIFDVGANIGQTVKLYKKSLPDSEIHSFEPSPATFQELVHNVTLANYQNTHLNNMAVGSSIGTNKFLENNYNNMSSFLEIGTAGWGEIVKETEVKTTTVDQYCREKNIPYISLLKSDTQGYELEVLKGCSEMFQNHQIEMILIEMNFSELYKGQPTFDELYRFLIDRGFRLVAFYEFRYQNNLAGWTNGLFKNVNLADSKVTSPSR